MLARELISGNSGTEVLGLLGSVATTFTAAGTTQATATALSAATTYVTTATAMQGALLPASMNPGDTMLVCNSTSVNICVYPPSGGKLNGATANVPLVMAPNKANTFISMNGTDWAVDAS